MTPLSWTRDFEDIFWMTFFAHNSLFVGSPCPGPVILTTVYFSELSLLTFSRSPWSKIRDFRSLETFLARISLFVEPPCPISEIVTIFFAQFTFSRPRLVLDQRS